VASKRPHPVPTAKGASSRAAILAASVPLFAERGYRGTSLAMIAETVGMTQPGLLHHFRSKQELLMALLDQRYHADGRVLTERAETGLGFFDVLLSIVEHNRTTPDLTKMFAVLAAEALAVDHPAHGYFVERYRKVRNRCARALRAGQAVGQIRDDIDIALVAPIVVAVMDGLQAQWLLDEDVDMVGCFELFCNLVGSQLATGDGGGDSSLASLLPEP